MTILKEKRRSPLLIYWSVGLFGFILLFFNSFSYAADWELEDEDDGISVYSRAVSGSELKEFKAEAIMNTSAISLVALMKDGAAGKEWIHNAKESKVLEEPNIYERYTYTVIDLPWPLDDRDMIVYSKTEINEKDNIVTISLMGKPDHMPKQGSYVRMPEVRGKWEFKAEGDKKAKVTYILYSNPGGNLSPSLVNGDMEKTMIATLENMWKIVQKPKYQKATAEDLQK